VPSLKKQASLEIKKKYKDYISLLYAYGGLSRQTACRLVFFIYQFNVADKRLYYLGWSYE